MLPLRYCNEFYLRLVKKRLESPLSQTLISFAFVNKLDKENFIVECDGKDSSDGSFIVCACNRNISFSTFCHGHRLKLHIFGWGLIKIDD